MKKPISLLLIILTIFSCKKEDSLSSEKLITEFTINTITGTIDENNKTITIGLPFGTEVTALYPEISVSEKSTISPASGIPADFTRPVKFIVTAEDGSQSEYTVSVIIENMKLPKKITNEDGAIFFKYNDRHQLIEYRENESDDWGLIINLGYNDAGELISATTSWTSLNVPLVMTYTRTGNTVTCSGQMNEKGEIRDVTYTIILDEYDLPSEIHNPYQSIDTYEYDSNRNPVTDDWRHTGNNQPETLWKAEYDQKKGILSNCTTPKWWWYQNRMWWSFLYNNPVEITYTKGTTSSWSNSYQYDDSGFPISADIDGMATQIEYN